MVWFSLSLRETNSVFFQCVQEAAKEVSECETKCSNDFLFVRYANRFSVGFLGGCIQTGLGIRFKVHVMSAGLCI